MSDAELAPLQALNNLSFLDLSGTPVTDAALAHVLGLTKTKLQYLNLSGTRVSDAGLVHLKGLTKLSHLQLFATQASCAGVQELRQAVPSLVIV
jgi:internalin A